MAYETDTTTGANKPTSDKSLSPEELTKWKTLLVCAMEYQRKNGNFVSGNNTKDGRWDVNIKAMDGDFNSREDLGEEAIDVNITSSTLQTLLSPLWTTEPHITVEPTMARVTDDDQEYDNILHAQITEYELNYWLRELEFRKVVKKCILDCAATNQAFSYWGYIENKSELQNDDGEVTENEPQIRLKRPFVKRISPKYVLMPPGYYDFEECPWFALGFLRCVKDVKDRYEVKDLKADVAMLDPTKYEGLEGITPAGLDYLKSEDAGFVVVWQIWDKRSKKLYSLALGHDKELACEDWPFDVEGFPSVKMRFNSVPDQQFGMPMMSAWLAQQKELNVARTSTRRRESRTKCAVFMLNVPDGVEEAYKKAEDGAIINMNAPDVDDIRKLLVVDPGLPPANSAYNYGATQIQDLFLISGLGAQQRSMGDPNIGSATASALVDKWAQIRQSDYGDIVRMFYLENAKKLWMILRQFPNVKRDMLVTGPTGQLQRITYSLSQLKGEFNFTMDLGAMFAQDPVTRRQNAFARYNLLRADPLIRGEKLAADLLKADRVTDVESYMTKLLSPQEEFMKMMQGLPCEAHELDDHIGHMKAHEKQRDQLMQLVSTSRADSPQEVGARTGLFLLTAHVNDHARIMKTLDSKNAEPGSPIDQNMMAQDVNMGSGETEAELEGGTVENDSMQTPAGIGVG